METLIWCNAHCPLSSSSCTTTTTVNDPSSSSSLLRVRVRDRRTAAGLVLLEWSCSCASESHSQWLDASTVAFVHHARNANTLLGRGSHEIPFEHENNAQLQLYESPQLGRFVAAETAIPIGGCALRATAFAVVVADRAATKYCHWCFTQLTKKAFRCGGCDFSLYCSHDCLEADAVLHDPQCESLHQLQSVTLPASTIDKETLRLTLAVIMMEAFVGNPHALEKLWVPLTTHRNPVEELALDLAVKLLRRHLKKTSKPAIQSVTRAHIRKTILRIQSNAHPLCLNGTSGVCSVGVFPEAAMTLNHSCAPNVVSSFDPATRTLRFHAVRPIESMELIEFSYLSDLIVGRARRQETLRDGFGFECTCRRCVNDATSTGSLDVGGSSTEEQTVLNQLITLSMENDPLAVGGKLRLMQTRHAMLLESRPDVVFSLKMLELRSATQTHDWTRVLAVAEELLSLWTAQGLPQYYTTTETLHQQIAVAAMRLGNAPRAKKATDRVTEIQRICGFHSTQSI